MGVETTLETLMILGLSTIVLYNGYELTGRPISRSGQWRALLLGVGVMISFTVLAFAVWLTWSIGGRSGQLSFLLAFAATLGAAVGTRGSLYAVQSEERITRAQELSKLLRINQRVLRHNLRNELSIALGYLENAESASDTEAVRDDLRTVRDHLEDLVETTDRTRRIVSIWDNDDTIAIDLPSLVEERTARIRTRYPNADVETTLPAECRVLAHPALSLVLTEALTNAIEHNPDDVSVTVTLTEPTDGTATLEIADTGTGIPKFDRDAITLPEETPLFHTQGLGLWIIYWAIEMSNGTLEFVANEPRGTIVRITLPTASRSSPVRG